MMNEMGRTIEARHRRREWDIRRTMCFKLAVGEQIHDLSIMWVRSAKKVQHVKETTRILHAALDELLEEYDEGR